MQSSVPNRSAPTARSTSFAKRSFSASPTRRVLTLSRTVGFSSRNRRMYGGSTNATAPGPAAIRNSSEMESPSCPLRTSGRPSIASTRGHAMPKSCSPAGEREMRGPLRSNSTASSSCSSSRTCIDTADCVIPRSAAARVML